MELPIELYIDPAFLGDFKSAELVHDTRYRGIRIGDSLTCIKSMDDDYHKFTEGKLYTIIKFVDIGGIHSGYYDIRLQDDRNNLVDFQIGSLVSGSFCSTYILRKFKLKDIEKNIHI